MLLIPKIYGKLLLQLVPISSCFAAKGPGLSVCLDNTALSLVKFNYYHDQYIIPDPVFLQFCKYIQVDYLTFAGSSMIKITIYVA